MVRRSTNRHAHLLDATPFETKPTLIGELVTLRPIRAEDADVIDHLIRTDPEIAVLTGSVHSSDEKPEGMPPADLLGGDPAVAA